MTATRREAAAGGAGGASSGEAASSDSLVTLPKEAFEAALQGDEAALLAWSDSGGQVNATCVVDDVSGVTALMAAARYGHERMVDLLLQRGAEINKQKSDGFTALMLAAEKGHERVVELLLQHGAEANLQNARQQRLHRADALRLQRPRAGGRAAASAQR